MSIKALNLTCHACKSPLVQKVIVEASDKTGASAPAAKRLDQAGKGRIMVRLNFTVTIDSPREHAWKTMLDPSTYPEWARAFSPNSKYAGDWLEGSSMLFTDPNMGGTKAVLEKVVPFQLIRARHLALLDREGTEDTQSEEAQKWIGTIEEYRFSESHGKTTLDVEMNSHEDLAGMFEESWPKALNILKELCERTTWVS